MSDAISPDECVYCGERDHADADCPAHPVPRVAPDAEKERLRADVQRLTAERDVAVAACAAMRAALWHAKAVAWAYPAHRESWEDHSQRVFDAALAPDAGTALLTQMAAMRAELQECLRVSEDDLELSSDNSDARDQLTAHVARLQALLAPDAGQRCLHRLRQLEAVAEAARFFCDCPHGEAASTLRAALAALDQEASP